MPDEEMGKEGPIGAGNELNERAFDLDGVIAPDKAESAAEAGDVGINDDAFVEPEGVTENDVGSFASDPGQGDEGVHGGGDLATVVFDKGAAAVLDVFGFAAEEAGGLDDSFDAGEWSGGEGGGVGKLRKEPGSHHVDADVGALGGEDGGDKELEWPLVVEFAVGVGISLFQNGKDLRHAAGAWRRDGHGRRKPLGGVGWLGLEPRTNALKGHCSTIELPTPYGTGESPRKTGCCQPRLGKM